MVEISEKYAALAAVVIEEHEDLHWLRQSDIDIGYAGSDVEKKRGGKYVLGECHLVPDPWTAWCPHDFAIVIYEPNIEGMSEDQLKILLYHELLHVDMDERNGKPVYKIRPHDVEEFREIIDKYGIDWPGGR